MGTAFALWLQAVGPGDACIPPSWLPPMHYCSPWDHVNLPVHTDSVYPTTKSYMGRVFPSAQVFDRLYRVTSSGVSATTISTEKFKDSASAISSHPTTTASATYKFRLQL